MNPCILTSGFQGAEPLGEIFRLPGLSVLGKVMSEYYRSIQESGDASNYLRFLEIYPEGLFRGLAEIRSSLE